LARQCPKIKFVVVGPDGTDEEYVSSIHKCGAETPNVNLVGPIDFSGVFSYYRQADVLCCTSKYEGFPNTFLEAWSQGLPIISTVDPDDVIARNRLGKVTFEPSQLAGILNEFMGNVQERDEMSDNALSYFVNNHEKDVAMERFENLLQRSLADRPG
jgi:glycosyltransferase involved in cell wall biosynthesis